ncbi:MAG: sugar-binding protein [Verrucomicrobiota bacterium]
MTSKTPKTVPQPTTGFRKAVIGGSLKTFSRLTVGLVAGITFVNGALALEKCKPVDAARLAQIVQNAPPVPVDLKLGLKYHLIDFIDCTDPNDPHDFRDQGTSQVVTGPAGKYRETAPHRYGFFSYAYRTAGKDKPVVLIIEYPDDAKRNIQFHSHDATRPGTPHHSFGFENGVYTGEPLPLTNKMQYFTPFLWPQDEWSPIGVMSYGRTGSAAAASRIWVYAIDEMPPLEVAAPDPNNPRVLDAFFALFNLASRGDYFGWKSPKWADHIVDYYRYIGVNRVTMEVYANSSWGAEWVDIPAWDTKDKGELDGMLSVFDKRGGLDFIAGIVAPSGYGPMTAGGKNVITLNDEEFRAVMIKGFDQFIDHYGKYKSLKGVALGSLEFVGFCDLLREKKALAEVVAHIKKRRPDWTVLTYGGGPWCLQRPYFDGNPGKPNATVEEFVTGTRRTPTPSAGDVIQRWETSGKPWSDFLGDEVFAIWKSWNRDPAGMKAVQGLDVYEYYAAEDSQNYASYCSEPRELIYFDLDNSPARSRHVDSPYAAIFDQFQEGWIGLSPELNFWYRKDWTAATTSPGGPFTLANFARVMGHRDRLAISEGAWSPKHFGSESAFRTFAKAFRSLPPVVMTDCPPAIVTQDPTGHDTDTVKVYSAEYQGRRYVAAQNRLPFAAGVTIDGAAHELKPYELAAWSELEKKGAPACVFKNSPDYRAYLNDRLTGFTKLYRDLRAVQAEAAPEIYLQTAQKARASLDAGRPVAADRILGLGLFNELRLRKDILQRPELHAPKIVAPPMKGDMNAWPKEASDLKADTGNFLVAHVHFPTSWSGPDDLSARLRLGHDGQKLYVGLEVRDNVLEKKDGVRIYLSRTGYSDWKKNKVPYDSEWSIAAPFDKEEFTGTGDFRYTCRKTKTGYVIEGETDLAKLGVQSGDSLGFLVQITDGDNTRLSDFSWAMKQMLSIPNKPNFPNWDDARNCGRLILEAGR